MQIAWGGCAEIRCAIETYLYKERRFPESLRIRFIIAVTGHRCKPVVLHLRSFKGGVVEWDELRCI